MFLSLFSYTLLFEYKYEYIEVVETVEDNSNATNGTIMKRAGFIKVMSKLKISFYEILLLIWILSLIAEEFRQVFATRSITRKNKLKFLFL